MQSKRLEVAFAFPASLRAFACAAAEAPTTESFRPARLRCEHLINPQRVDKPRPRLSWIVESSSRNQFQPAYQIAVGSDRDAFARGAGGL